MCDLIYDRAFVHDYALRTTLNRNTGAPRPRQRHPHDMDVRRLSPERIREHAPGAMTSLGYLSHAARYPCAGRWASALSDPYLVPLEPPHSGTAVFTNRLMLPAGCLAPLFGTGHAEKSVWPHAVLQPHSRVCADSRGSVLMLPIVEHQVDELCNLLLSCDQFTLDG